MRANHLLSQPLAIVDACAVGAGGLDATTVGAAMWSHVARFELVAGELWGVPDVLRLALCPLFDKATPRPLRLQAMLGCCQQSSTQAHDHASEVHLLAPAGAESAIAPLLQPMPHATYQTRAGFVAALEAIGAQVTSVKGALRGTIVAVDSHIDEAHLQACHQAKKLSTEQEPEGLVASEGAATLTLMDHAQAQAAQAPILGLVRGACALDLGLEPAAALAWAVKQALGEKPAQVHTILWDIGGFRPHLTTMAEALLMLDTIAVGAQLVRPVQYIGCTGLCFAAQATVLALHGSRAGLTLGGRTLIVSIDEQTATAVLIESEWRPHIMLADAQRPNP